MHVGAREKSIFSNFYLTNHLLNDSLKRKTDNIPSIIRRMTRATARTGAGKRIAYVARLYRRPIVECRRPKSLAT